MSWRIFQPVLNHCKLLRRADLYQQSVSQSRCLCLPPNIPHPAEKKSAKSFVDSDQVKFVDLHNNTVSISFGELKAKARDMKAAKGRDLVKVIHGGKKESLTTFRILSVVELEAVVRKNRHLKTNQHFSIVNVDDGMTESHRIKEKHIVIRVRNLQQDTIDLSVKKITSWLQKGHFVQVTVHTGGKKAETLELENTLKERCLIDELADKREYLLFKLLP